MSENTSNVVWLTQDAYDKLIEELEFLKTEGREQVSVKIGAAREEGDLSENGGYHAAREEQGQMEARIRQLEEMLRHAEVGTARNTGEVVPGVFVTIAFDGDLDDTDTFLLGSREVLGIAETEDISVYSPQSPLGAAVLGAQKGDVVTYPAPNGREISVTVLEISAFNEDDTQRH